MKCQECIRGSPSEVSGRPLCGCEVQRNWPADELEAAHSGRSAQGTLGGPTQHRTASQDCTHLSASCQGVRESGRREHELGVRVPPDLVRILRTE